MHRWNRQIRWKRLIPVLAMAAVFLYSTISLIRYIGRSVDTSLTNAELAAVYEQEKAQQAEQPTEPPETPAPTIAALQPSAAPPTAASQPELLEAYQYIGPAYLPVAAELRTRNMDMAAWIEIPEVVNLPVVYRNNTYYLNHDFYGKRNDSGTLFLDEAHPFEEDTQYLVIHGHDMHDGSMFGLVSRYRMNGYLEAHPTVYFSTLYRKEEYEVVGVLTVSTDVNSENFVAYTGTRKFDSVDHFYAFADMLRSRAMHWKAGVELQPTDALLGLSTCYEDERVLVVCRRVGIMG